MNQIIFIISNEKKYPISRISLYYNFTIKKNFTEELNGALIEIPIDKINILKNDIHITIIEEKEIFRTKYISKYLNYPMYKKLLKNKN